MRRNRNRWRRAFWFGVTAALLLVPWSAARTVGETENRTAGWKLVWADEFERNGKPDPRNWNCESGFVRNEELQWYQPENARCEAGRLVIEARRETKANPNYSPNGQSWQTLRKQAEYTSASLTTKGLHAWRYGRFEIRARIDTRPGLWPCFWTMGVSGEWPAGGEIDIMEYFQGTLRANTAWATKDRWTPRWDAAVKPLAKFMDANWSEKFHIWLMDWDEQTIRLSIDGVLMNETDLKNTFNEDREGKNPFREPHYLLLSLAVGGTSGGDPSATKFPAKIEVDYVRIFQKKPPQGIIEGR